MRLADTTSQLDFRSKKMGNATSSGVTILRQNSSVFSLWTASVIIYLIRYVDIAVIVGKAHIRRQVVAPVRETAAQALAALLPFMSPSSVVGVQSILLEMVNQNGAPPSAGLDAKASTEPTKSRAKYVWQVRHSGLLGLKYVVAVRAELYRRGTSGGDVEMKSEVQDDVKPTIKTEAESVTLPSDFLLKRVVDVALIG